MFTTHTAPAVPPAPTTPDLAAIKRRQQQAWAAGDYAVVGSTLVIIAELLCEAVDLRAGQKVLDVATGNGNAALAAARRFCPVVGVDYVPALLERARQRAKAEGLEATFQEGDAEDLPFPDAAFDTVVASLVLCTVPDLSQTLAEARRVLRPGGTLRFYQHVRAADPRLARWQDRLEHPWGWLAGGCHPNRDTLAAITAAGLRVVQLDRFELHAMPPLVRPHVLGVAERPR